MMNYKRKCNYNFNNVPDRTLQIAYKDGTSSFKNLLWAAPVGIIKNMSHNLGEKYSKLKLS